MEDVGFRGFSFQAEDGIRNGRVTGFQTCALPIWRHGDTGTRGRGDTGARGHGDTATRRKNNAELDLSANPAFFFVRLPRTCAVGAVPVPVSPDRKSVV